MRPPSVVPSWSRSPHCGAVGRPAPPAGQFAEPFAAGGGLAAARAAVCFYHAPGSEPQRGELRERPLFEKSIQSKAEGRRPALLCFIQ